MKTVTRTQGNNEALKDGSVRPRTFAFEFVEVDPLIAAFRRMVRGLEFDICEMAITTYICAKAHGKPMTAVPVFLVRAFHHGAILVNANAGIRTPKDLEGRKVGVNRGYTVTTGLWARSILQHEHGVDLSKVTWVLNDQEHVEDVPQAATAVRFLENPPFLPAVARPPWRAVWAGALACLPPLGRTLLRTTEPPLPEVAACRALVRAVGRLLGEPLPLRMARRRLA